MRDQKGDAERLASFEFVDKSGDRALAQRFVGRAEVEQVGIVRDDPRDPGLLLIALEARRSRPALYGFDAHWRDDLVKIWMQSHPIGLPRGSASLTPPAIDMCAPSSGLPIEEVVEAAFAIFDSRGRKDSTTIPETRRVTFVAPASPAILYDRAAKSRRAGTRVVRLPRGAGPVIHCPWSNWM